MHNVSILQMHEFTLLRQQIQNHIFNHTNFQRMIFCFKSE